MTPRRGRGPHCLGGPAGLLRRHDARDASRRGRVDGDRSPSSGGGASSTPCGPGSTPPATGPAGSCSAPASRASARPGSRRSWPGWRSPAGRAVAWGRCVEAEGAPRLLAVAPGAALARTSTPTPCSPGTSSRPRTGSGSSTTWPRRCWGAAGRDRGLVVILDDIHWADEPSLLVLRHLADQVAGPPVLVFATFRDVEPASVPRPACSPTCCGRRRSSASTCGASTSPRCREQLSALAAGASAAGRPRGARGHRRQPAVRPRGGPAPSPTAPGVRTGRRAPCSTSSAPGSTGSPPDCRRLVQAAAIVGRDFSLALVAADARRAGRAVPSARRRGDRVRPGRPGRPTAASYRFVHALTRDAVEASLTTADRVALHRAVAEAIEAQFAGDLSEHLADIARHWAAARALRRGARPPAAWAIRAADDAVRRLAYEEGVRLYRAALALDAADGARRRAVPGADRARPGRLLRRRPARAASEPPSRRRTPPRAAESPSSWARPRSSSRRCPTPASTPSPSSCARRRSPGSATTAHEALRARLLAQRSHLAFYDGEQDRVERVERGGARPRPRGRATTGRSSMPCTPGKEACPGPAGRAERHALATEMLALAQRTNSARTAMWGELWRIDALVESGQLAAAADELPALRRRRRAGRRAGQRVAPRPGHRVHRPGAGPLRRRRRRRSAGIRADARRSSRRPATGAYFALQCALAGHVGVTDEAAAFAQRPFEAPPRFRTMGRISRALPAPARRAAPTRRPPSYQQAGPLETWSLPGVLRPARATCTAPSSPPSSVGTTTSRVLLDRLEPFRGEHAVGEGVAYLGPGRAHPRPGGRRPRPPRPRPSTTWRSPPTQADRAGAPGFVAEARYHLATALLARGGPGDRERADAAARDADRLARALGMAAYVRPHRRARRACSPAPVTPDGAEPARGRGRQAGRRGPHQPPDRRAAGHLRAHRAEPRAAHPHQAGLHHPEPDRRMERAHGK